MPESFAPTLLGAQARIAAVRLAVNEVRAW